MTTTLQALSNTAISSSSCYLIYNNFQFWQNFFFFNSSLVDLDNRMLTFEGGSKAIRIG